jgi:hypothetical protein
MKKIKDFLI